MIYTNMPRNCVVFFLPRRLTVSVRDVKGNRAILNDTCVDHYILLLKHLSNHMHFITNGFKRF